MHPQDLAMPGHGVLSSKQNNMESNSSNEQWSLVSSFSKESAQEAWTAGTSPSRGTMNKIHLPTTSQDPAAESETIIDQALSVVLNVVSDESFVEAPSRKIAKKRRKENDEDGLSSSIHHTTSSKEYLRKVQESLRQNNELSSDTESSQESQKSRHSGRSNSNLQPDRGIHCQRRSNFATKKHEPSKATKDGASSNPYGYEDPDAAMPPRAPTCRRVGTYRRRGSVTKFSVQATAAAAAATDRIMRLGLHQLESPRSLQRRQQALDAKLMLSAPLPFGNHSTESSNDTSQLPRQGGRPPAGSSLDSADTKPYPRSSSLRGTSYHLNEGGCAPVQSPRGQRSMRKAILRRNSAKMNTQQTSAEAASTNPYGYEDPDANQKVSNQYGYEDPDAAVQKKSTQPANVYGYGDTSDRQVEQPPRRRATRRGSVTKFSLDAAKVVVSSEHDIKPKKMALDHLDQHPYRRRSMTEATSTTKPLTNFETTKESMFQSPEFTMRRSQLLNLSRSPYFSTENRSQAESLSDSEPESSDIDSVASFGDEEYIIELADGSGGAPKLPRRVDSIESDASSLAPDLRSYCSISRGREDDQDMAPPPPPTFVPLTSTPRKSPLSMAPKVVVSRRFSREGLCQQNITSPLGFREAFNHGGRSASFNSVPLVTFPDMDYGSAPLSTTTPTARAPRFARRGAV